MPYLVRPSFLLRRPPELELVHSMMILLLKNLYFIYTSHSFRYLICKQESLSLEIRNRRQEIHVDKAFKWLDMSVIFQYKESWDNNSAGYPILVHLSSEWLPYFLRTTVIMQVFFRGVFLSRNRWYPAKRALAAMLTHGRSGLFGRIPSIDMASGIETSFWGFCCHNARGRVRNRRSDPDVVRTIPNTLWQDNPINRSEEYRKTYSGHHCFMT